MTDWSVARCKGVPAFLLLMLVARPLFADAPTVEHMFPAGFPRGSTNSVTIAGKFDPWPPKVWVDCAGIVFTAETNKGRFRVEIAREAPPGAHLFRMFNEDGASLPRIMVVSEANELLEAEPNNHFTNATTVRTLPVVMNGRLDKSGDVDSYAINLTAGQALEARLDAYMLASKMDALLRLITPDGVQLCWNHDFTTLDPRLAWQAPSNGTYLIQVMGFKYPADAEVRLTGGDGCVYRLHLAVDSPIRTAVSGSDLREQEPNDMPTNAPSIDLPGSIAGVISEATDEDCFAFAAEKGASIEASVEAAALGSPLDAWVKIADGAGKELARNDDASGTRDPRLEWKSPTNGTFFVCVGNLLHGGGPEHAYRLSIRLIPPDYRVTVASSSFRLKAGETNDVKFTVTRLRGFKHKLKAALQGLPEGTSAEAVEVSEKGGEHALRLIAAPDAPSAQTAVRLVITDDSTSEDRFARFSLTSSSEDNGVPGGYRTLLVESTDQLWLTVSAKPAAK